MLSEKIESVRAALGELAGMIKPEQWDLISNCRNALAGAQESAVELEQRLIPQPPQAQPATAR